VHLSLFYLARVDKALASVSRAPDHRIPGIIVPWPHARHPVRICLCGATSLSLTKLLSQASRFLPPPLHSQIRGLLVQNYSNCTGLFVLLPLAVQRQSTDITKLLEKEKENRKICFFFAPF
jgi:hypothetical protein